MNKNTIISALSNFGIIDGKPNIELISTGYINQSYKVTTKYNLKYILQKLNTNVFKNEVNMALLKLILLKSNSSSLTGFTIVRKESPKSNNSCPGIIVSKSIK